MLLEVIRSEVRFTYRLGDEVVEGVVHSAELASDAGGVKHREKTGEKRYLK